MITVHDFDNAPAWARYASTFKRDETCRGVHCVIGDSYEELLPVVVGLMNSDPSLVDRDINQSDETGAWVGVTVKDA